MTDLRAPTGGWTRASVRAVTHPTSHGVSLRLEVRDRVAHWAGQHYVVRLTADDGYTAQRSYSIVSAPSDGLVELYIERLEDGEVSTYLADIVEVGDELEVRGPIGGWFVWSGDSPSVGVGGGSGVVPLIAMRRHAASIGQLNLIQLVVSARTFADLPYAHELATTGAVIVLSREATAGGRAAGRLSAADVEPVLAPHVTYFVCGSPSFSDSASELLLSVGVAPESIRVESFGSSG